MTELKYPFVVLSVLSALATASAAQQSNIQGAIGNLEDASRSFLAVATLFMFVAGAALLAIGIGIYFLKLSKAYKKKESVWVAAGFLCGGLGLLLVLGAILGLLIYLFTPNLIQGLMGAPA